MRLPGPAEIILILVVAAIVLIGVGVLGTPARRKSQSIARNEMADEESDEDYEARIKKTRRSRIQLAGVIVIIGGIFILLSSLSLIKWVFWGPIGAIIIMAIGIVTIVVARRR